MGTFKPRKKLRNRYRKTLQKPRLPRRLKKEFKKAFGKDSFLSWRESQPQPLTVKFTTVRVQSRTRELRATWTPELAEEIETYHGIDVEAYLTRTLQEELNRAIDEEG